MRDIEAVFTDETGRCVLTNTGASELSERLWADYQAFAARDVAEFKVLYVFVDGIAERLHLGQAREAVLAAWAIIESGATVLLGVAPGTTASRSQISSTRRTSPDRARPPARHPQQ